MWQWANDAVSGAPCSAYPNPGLLREVKIPFVFFLFVCAGLDEGIDGEAWEEEGLPFQNNLHMFFN